MAVKSRRLRFEILKRDGFRCRYCGISSLDAVLHVDHVVPESKGGTDDPVNLITACSSCNLGKTDRSLDESHLQTSPTIDAVQEHVTQVDAYLQHCRELDAARRRAEDYVIEVYGAASPSGYVHSGIHDCVGHMLRRYRFEQVVDAARITAAKRGIDERAQYMWGVLRKLDGNAARTNGPEIDLLGSAAYALSLAAARLASPEPQSEVLTPEGPIVITLSRVLEHLLSKGKLHGREDLEWSVRRIRRVRGEHGPSVEPVMKWLESILVDDSLWEEDE